VRSLQKHLFFIAVCAIHYYFDNIIFAFFIIILVASFSLGDERASCLLLLARARLLLASKQKSTGGGWDVWLVGAWPLPLEECAGIIILLLNPREEEIGSPHTNKN
jgi:hypothetical protein